MDKLEAQINTLRQEMDAALPEDLRDIQQRAIQKLQESETLETAANPGDRFPQFSLPNASGNAISSDDLLANGPLIISFYRGGWCPYCNLELRAYQALLPDIRELGGDFIAISPQLADESSSTAAKAGLSYEVLSDAGNSLAEHLGLVFELAPAIVDLYRSRGFDLERINGNLSWTLPVPATYVLAPDGVIVDAFLHADHTVRKEPQEVLEVLRGL